MVPQFLSYLIVWVLGFGVASVCAQKENDFRNSPTTRKVPMRSFSLSTPYLDSDMSNRWFDFGGDTIIRADRYIRLTSDRQSERGWLFSRMPLSATNWQIEVEFSIHGEGSLHGDGLAMWLVKDRANPGPVFGSADKFEGLGIFIDTYKNGRKGVTFPLVMAMMGNGNTEYDAAHDGKANELASCSARGIRGASVPTKLRLTYFQDKYLALDLQYKADQAWTSCFKVIPTEEVPVKFPSISYLGFSAETGELHDHHDILSVETSSLYSQAGSRQGTPGTAAKQQGNTQNSKKPVKAKDTSDSDNGWLWSFFKFLMFLTVIAGGYVGWTLYRSSQRGSRF